jgi:MFS superfamily sulfate permease-like transporter
VRVTVVSSTPERIVIRIESALYTANVVQAFQIVEEEVEKAGRPPQLVLDCSALRILSVTVLDAFRDLERELHSGGTAIVVAGLPEGALATARKTTWYRNLEAEGRTAPKI